MHWLYDPELTANSNQLPDVEAKHAKALRLLEGEPVVITNGSGLCVEAVFGEGRSYSVTRTFELQPPKTKFHLVQALAKSDRDEMALQAACELGVSSVTPWESARSIVKWDGKEQRNLDRWRQIAISAMKQSQQAYLPQIEALAKTKDLKPSGLGLILVPGAEKTLRESISEQSEVTLVVGPEGGLSPTEISQLEAQGFLAVRLGSSVLRTSTAGPAAIAAMQFFLGNWG